MEDVKIGRMLAEKGYTEKALYLSQVLRVQRYPTFRQALARSCKYTAPTTGRTAPPPTP